METDSIMLNEGRRTQNNRKNNLTVKDHGKERLNRRGIGKLEETFTYMKISQ